MIDLIFSLDYEIHGNGDGSPSELMVEPTDRLLSLFNEFGAKLTIMADVAEILKFKEWSEQTGRDSYGYHAIVEQLTRAVATGHDVQLHIHSSYFNARCEGGCWRQDWSEYDFAGLPYERMNWMVGTCKAWLESILQMVRPSYRCIAFRAANWSVSPSFNVVRALVANGIEIDTSVFKYGRREGLVNFDYSSAPSAMVPWLASETDICMSDDAGKLMEFPIYCENRWMGAFLTLSRIRRVLMTRAHRLQESATIAGPNVLPAGSPRSRILRHCRGAARRHAWKADFNQCTGRQLIAALRRAERNHATVRRRLPFVLIGHSKQFDPANEGSLRPFLTYISRNRERFAFAIFPASNAHWKAAPVQAPLLVSAS